MNRKKYSYSFIILISVSFFFITVPVSADGITPQQRFLQERGCNKALIVNGDDLGRTIFSNEGILKSFREGILTSTSFMVPARAAEDAYRVLRENPDIDVGVHLVLAIDNVEKRLRYGPVSPLESVRSLVDQDGNFFTNISTVMKQGDRKEVGRELYAQVKKAIENGVDVSHLDCHMGFYHTYDPKSLKATLKIARKFDLPIRWAGSSQDPMLKRNGIVVPDFITGVSMQTEHSAKKEAIMNELKKLKDGITEIYLHPATGGLSEAESVWRRSDLEITLDTDIKNLIKENNICLIGYKDLRDFQRILNAEKAAAEK